MTKEELKPYLEEAAAELNAEYQDKYVKELMARALYLKRAEEFAIVKKKQDACEHLNTHWINHGHEKWCDDCNLQIL